MLGVDVQSFKVGGSGWVQCSFTYSGHEWIFVFITYLIFNILDAYSAFYSSLNIVCICEIFHHCCCALCPAASAIEQLSQIGIFATAPNVHIVSMSSISRCSITLISFFSYKNNILLSFYVGACTHHVWGHFWFHDLILSARQTQGVEMDYQWFSSLIPHSITLHSNCM